MLFMIADTVVAFDHKRRRIKVVACAFPGELGVEAHPHPGIDLPDACLEPDRGPGHERAADDEVAWRCRIFGDAGDLPDIGVHAGEGFLLCLHGVELGQFIPVHGTAGSLSRSNCR